MTDEQRQWIELLKKHDGAMGYASWADVRWLVALAEAQAQEIADAQQEIADEKWVCGEGEREKAQAAEIARLREMVEGPSGRKVYSEEYVNGLADIGTKYLEKCDEQRREIARANHEIDRLTLENGKLRAVAATGAALIRSLQATVDALADPAYPIRISRREMMDLPLETRRRVMKRCADRFIAANGPEIAETALQSEPPEA